MDKFQLKVIATGKEGRFGVLSLVTSDGIHPFAVTLEHTFDTPAGPQALLPLGLYRCQRSMYHKGGYWTYEIPLAGHERVLLHKGNTESDSRGCVLVGEMYSVFGTKGHGIGSSSAGFEEFMALTSGAKEIELEITS